MSHPSVARSVVILAAGAGTRMRSTTPKVLHHIAGRSMLSHVIDVADRLQAQQVCVVVSPSAQAAIAAECGSAIAYIPQHEQRGTAHALQQAFPHITTHSGDVIVLFGDTPLIQAETITALLEHVHRTGARVGIVSFDVEPPHNYGRIVRDANGAVTAIVEAKNCTPEQIHIREANSGIMVIDYQWLQSALPRITPNELTGELYLTDLVALANHDAGSGAACALAVSDISEAWGVNTRAQLAEASRLLQQRVTSRLMEQGVTIVDPQQVLIAPEVRIGADSVIWPGCVITGATLIGTGCHIGPQSTIHASHIGADSHVPHAYIKFSTIEAGTVLAPHSALVATPPQSTHTKEESQSQD